LRGLELNSKTLFHKYGSPPASIKAVFEEGVTITIYFGGDDKIFAVIDDSQQPITSKSQAARLKISPIYILPQVGLLQREEYLLKPDYFDSVASGPYQSIHFRNHIAYNPDLFSNFKNLTAESWPGVGLVTLDKPEPTQEGPISLTVRDREFAAEAGWMGHGLQMWLQIIWFLVQAGPDSTVILDEPDVYMHADLQRRLIRILRNKHKQTIVATHSIEILSEVPPESVLIIDRDRPTSQFAGSNPAVQRIVDQIGAIHNIQLARLWASRKMILVEGNDLSALGEFQKVLEPRSTDSLELVPNMEIGGWSGWPYVIGSQLFLRNAAGEEIKMYCVLDRDYHTESEINERNEQARTKGICLHIWKKKEIENYMLSPAAIRRVVNAWPERNRDVTESEVAQELERISERLKTDVFDALSNEFLLRDRREGLPLANRKAREYLDTMWRTAEGRLSVIPGKRAFSMMADWTQANVNVSLSKSKTIAAMTIADVPDEIKEVIAMLSS
jgi:hypothetical protein